MKSIEECHIDYMIGVTRRKEAHKLLLTAIGCLFMACFLLFQPARADDLVAPELASPPPTEQPAKDQAPETSVVDDFKSAIKSIAIAIGAESAINKDQEVRLAAVEAKLSAAPPIAKQAVQSRPATKTKAKAKTTKKPKSAAAQKENYKYGVRGISEFAALVQNQESAAMVRYVVGDSIPGRGIITAIDPISKTVVTEKGVIN